MPMLIEAAPDNKKGEYLAFSLQAYNYLSEQDLDGFRKNLLRWRTLGTNTERRKKTELVSKLSGKKDSFWAVIGSVSYSSGSELNRLLHRLGLDDDKGKEAFSNVVADFKMAISNKSEQVNVKPQNGR